MNVLQEIDSMAKRAAARSRDVDNCPKAFVRPLKSVYRIKGDEMF